MFRFENPYYFAWLCLIPLFYFLYLFSRSRSQKNLLKLGDLLLLKKEISEEFKFQKFKHIAFLLGFFFCAIALVNPQFGKRMEKVRSSNVDIMLALDVSSSMLASDIQPSRLQRAQLWIKQFTERFSAERIGLICFAGNAYLQSPLTTDIATIQLISSMASPQTIGTQGTSIAAAIDQANKAMRDQNGNHKILVLITDGEDHEENVLTGVKKAKENGISIITVPIGKEEGAYVPELNNNANSYKIDKDGKYVISIPNRKLLNEIAQEGQGEMIEINSGDAVFDHLKKRFSIIAKQETTMQSFSNYESYFQYFLFIGICFFIADYLIARPRR